ncbi:hypothetical protein ATN00_22165 (plasmid) [Sphingobium baderi]|uniref:Uncharacterized protein n=1 Tax=Sphingobium baderi TaxID=1332080 RepID=A0A0S3F6B5_9SPHN|nr:hypothetical protein ATN00_22165 [Sphingobium baderi]
MNWTEGPLTTAELGAISVSLASLGELTAAVIAAFTSAPETDVAGATGAGIVTSRARDGTATTVNAAGKAVETSKLLWMIFLFMVLPLLNFLRTTCVTMPIAASARAFLKVKNMSD